MPNAPLPQAAWWNRYLAQALVTRKRIHTTQEEVLAAFGCKNMTDGVRSGLTAAIFEAIPPAERANAEVLAAEDGYGIDLIRLDKRWWRSWSKQWPYHGDSGDK